MSELSPAAGVLVTDRTTAKPDSETNVQVETGARLACLLIVMLLPVAWATSALVSSVQAAVAAPLPAAVAAALVPGAAAEVPLLPGVEQAASSRTHSTPATASCPRRVPDERTVPPLDLVCEAGRPAARMTSVVLPQAMRHQPGIRGWSGSAGRRR